ncbi:uncharacterized protein LOC119304699 [Triticum dicoccoides]|nr:uncharacterized protein LOC119304699 [Triticum dicoccoides]
MPRPARTATMAAVRCAARSLGGSLLQRTQAAVAEEGRRLVPSRFMRSRQLSTKHAGKIPKELEPSEVDAQYKLARAKLGATLDKLEKEQADKTMLRLKSIGRAVDGVINGVVKLAAFCMVTAVAFGGEGVEAQAVTKGSQ